MCSSPANFSRCFAATQFSSEKIPPPLLVPNPLNQNALLNPSSPCPPISIPSSNAQRHPSPLQPNRPPLQMSCRYHLQKSHLLRHHWCPRPPGPEHHGLLYFPLSFLQSLQSHLTRENTKVFQLEWLGGIAPSSTTGKDRVVGATRTFNFTGPDGPAGGYYQISEVVRRRIHSLRSDIKPC